MNANMQTANSIDLVVKMLQLKSQCNAYKSLFSAEPCGAKLANFPFSFLYESHVTPILGMQKENQNFL